MERIRLETDRDERIRRQVRENSLELRELENKLRDAYTGRVGVGVAEGLCVKLLSERIK